MWVSVHWLLPVLGVACFVNGPMEKSGSSFRPAVIDLISFGATVWCVARENRGQAGSGGTSKISRSAKLLTSAWWSPGPFVKTLKLLNAHRAAAV